MRNRIKELRDLRGWSLEELASRFAVPVTASTIHKLETDAMKLTTEWMVRLGQAFGIDPIEIIDDRGRPGLAEDVVPFVGRDGPAALAVVPPKPGHGRYLVTSDCLDEVGLLRGALVDVDESEAARAGIATGDIVIADVAVGPGDVMTTVMREFVEPALIVTNSRADNALPINTRTTRTILIGVVVGSHRQIGRMRR